MPLRVRADAEPSHTQDRMCGDSLVVPPSWHTCASTCSRTHVHPCHTGCTGSRVFLVFSCTSGFAMAEKGGWREILTQSAGTCLSSQQHRHHWLLSSAASLGLGGQECQVSAAHSLTRADFASLLITLLYEPGKCSDFCSTPNDCWLWPSLVSCKIFKVALKICSSKKQFDLMQFSRNTVVDFMGQFCLFPANDIDVSYFP